MEADDDVFEALRYLVWFYDRPGRAGVARTPDQIADAVGGSVDGAQLLVRDLSPYGLDFTGREIPGTVPVAYGPLAVTGVPDDVRELVRRDGRGGEAWPPATWDVPERWWASLEG